MEKHISQTLSAATKLKSLCVIAHWEKYDNRCRPGGTTAFQEILSKCEFPQLRTLILHGFTSTEAELVGFLRGSSHLQQLTLTSHELRWNDKWESCANEIKIALPVLEHILVDALASNYNGYSPVHHFHNQYCCRKDVQGFFFQGKANPFVGAPKADKHTRITFVITDNEYRAREAQGREALWRHFQRISYD